MASSCSLCTQEGKKSDPTEWCPQCSQLLCQSCANHHKLFNTTKDHEVIPYDDYKKLPTFIVNIKSFCSEHKEKFSEFCRIHDTPICSTCKKVYHKTCDDVPKIEEIVQNVKDSVLFEDIIIEIETVCKKLNEVSEDRIENLKHLKSIRNELKKSFELKIDNIIEHLIKLKEKTISEIDTMHNELTNDLSNTSQILQSKEKKLSQILDQKDDIRRFASDYQTFIGLKEMEKMVQDIYTDLNDLSQQEKINQYAMTFEMNKTIEDIGSGIHSLGDVTVTKSPSDLSIHVTRPTTLQAQTEVQIQILKKLHFLQTIDLKEKSWLLGKDYFYFGCCILPGGHMVFANSGNDSDKNCKVYVYKGKPVGSRRSTIKFKNSDGVWGVTLVDDLHVAVSHPDSATISILNIVNEKAVRTMKTGVSVFGLCCRGRDILGCVSYDGIVRVNIDSEEIETVVKDMSVDRRSHVVVGNNRICYTCPETHTVTILDTKYNVTLKYKDEVVLEVPSGLTIDDKDIIYVTGHNSNNLVVISPDGKSCHQLLGEEDGLTLPSSVHYDSGTKTLVVVNKVGGPAFVYSVE